MPEHHSCFDCDEEFTVRSVYESESEISFCPFCGSELELEEDDDFDGELDEYDDDTRN